MIKITKTISLAIVLILLSACVYTKMYHFEGNDKDWVSVYDIRDTILFTSSDRSRIDTLFVKEKECFDTKIPFIRNEASSKMEAYGLMKCSIVHGNRKFELLTFIKKIKCDELKVFLSFGNRLMNTEIEINPSLSKTKVNNSLYDDVIVLCDSNSHTYDSSPADCTYFVWSRLKGLLQYEFENGETYTLYKKISH